jgi:hypothetical protein
MNIIKNDILNTFSLINKIYKPSIIINDEFKNKIIINTNIKILVKYILKNGNLISVDSLLRFYYNRIDFELRLLDNLIIINDIFVYGKKSCLMVHPNINYTVNDNYGFFCSEVKNNKFSYLQINQIYTELSIFNFDQCYDFKLKQNKKFYKSIFRTIDLKN